MLDTLIVARDKGLYSALTDCGAGGLSSAVGEMGKETGAVVTVEEHQVMGGMGSAVAEILSKKQPVPIEMIGIQDRWGESGEPQELIEHFGLGATHIIKAVKKVLRRK